MRQLITENAEKKDSGLNRTIINRFIYFAVLLFSFSLSGASGAFLDFSQPVREAGMGGDGVATATGLSSLVFNPAGLGAETDFTLSARYENLFSGIDGDNLYTGNLSAVLPFWKGNVFGFSLDSFDANNLQQTRLEAAFGKSFDDKSFLKDLRLGADFSYVLQQFTLSVPLQGVNLSNVSAGAFSLGLGGLYQFTPDLNIGLSVSDLNQPNLGIVGTDRFPVLWRYGISSKFHIGDDRLLLTLAQSFNNTDLETQGGAEWSFSKLGVCLRAGAGTNTGTLGLGWKTGGLFIDYAYQFSIGDAPSVNGLGIPDSHLLEIGFSWAEMPKEPKEPKIYEGLIEKGKLASAVQNWKDAFWYFQQSLLLHPGDPVALDGRANALLQYNRQRAANYFTAGQLAERKGYFPEAERNYEWASYLTPAETAYSDALGRMKKALAGGALSDPQVQKFLEKAVSLLKAGQNTLAMTEMKEAQKLYPDDAFIAFLINAFSRKALAVTKPVDKKIERWTVEAEIYRSKGRMDMAQDTWKKILASDPENAQAKENLAQSQTAAAAKVLTPAEKTQVQALQEQGLKAYLGGDVDGAIRDWEEILKIDANNANALNNLTRAKMEEGTLKK